MVDREKVINGLKACIVQNPDDHRNCNKCPYKRRGITNEPCFNGLMIGALELLKELEPVAPKIYSTGSALKVATSWYACGSCGKSIDPQDKFCRHCGKEVALDG